MPADNELTAKLSRRLDRNEALEQGQQVSNNYRTTGISIYTEFSEFSRKQIKEYEKAFKKSLIFSSFSKTSCISPLYTLIMANVWLFGDRYDAGGDGYLDLEELKVLLLMA